MPSNRVTAGNKRTRATNAPTPTTKWTKKPPNKRPRPLTTDDIPVLVREVCKNLLPHQTEVEAAIQGRPAEEHREESRGTHRTRRTATDREDPQQLDGEDDRPANRQNSTGSQSSTDNRR